MQLTTFTDYAFRILIYLAMEPDRHATISEIAAYFGISRHHLVKVGNHLGHGGFITTIRGKGGGLQLARPAEKIQLGEIVRWMEPGLSLVECQKKETKGHCRAAPNCALAGILSQAMQSFLATLDQHTLQDAIAPPSEQPFSLNPPSTRRK